LRGGLKVVTAQDIAHGQLVDMVPKICQCPLDAPVPPGRILLGHADHELFDLFGHTRSAKLTTWRTPVKFLGDQSLVPTQERVRRGDRGDLFEALTTERMGQCREAAAVEVGFEDAVFLLQIGDDPLLVPLDPPGNHGDQDMENHNSSSG
jgi:hypothetical protein